MIFRIKYNISMKMLLTFFCLASNILMLQAQSYQLKKTSINVASGQLEGLTYKTKVFINATGSTSLTSASFQLKTGLFPLRYNEDPTDIGLTSLNVDENQAVGTEVAILSTIDPELNDLHTYSLISGEGSTDNASFSILGNQLLTAEIFDFETKSSYKVRIRTDDGDGGGPEGVFDKAFTITINNLNDAPTEVVLSGSQTIDENLPIATPIGNLSTVDQDIASADDAHTYSFVAGAGDTDNGAFELVGDQLQSAEVFDFEVQRDYSIRIRTTDSEGAVFEKAIAVTIVDTNDAPTDITLTGTTYPNFFENEAPGTLIANLATTDVDKGSAFTGDQINESHLYELVTGDGSSDNQLFDINGTQIVLKDTLNFDRSSADPEIFSFRIKSMDLAGEVIEKAFTVNVSNLDDPPRGLQKSVFTVSEDASVGTTIGFISPIDDDNEPNDNYIFSIVAGLDASDFDLSGNQLRTNTTFNYAVKTEYSVTIRISDFRDLDNSTRPLPSDSPFSIEKVISIFVIDGTNAVPTAIQLSSNAVVENMVAGNVVATLSTVDADVNDDHTYSLVDAGSYPDNSYFSIEGSVLKLTSDVNRPVDDIYQINIQTNDGRGGVFSNDFTLVVSEFVNSNPIDINLSSATVDQSLALSSVVGTLSTSDINVNQTFTYELVSDESGNLYDNSSFFVDGNQLKTQVTFDFNVKTTYQVNVKTTDNFDGTFIKLLTINVVNNAPTDLVLRNNSLNENVVVGTEVGKLSTTDLDLSDNHSYGFVSGIGDSDNASFQLVGDRLETAMALNFEEQSSYTVRIVTDDSNGGTLEKQLAIIIVDVNDEPVVVELVDRTENELNEIAFTVSAVDEDLPAQELIYSIDQVSIDLGMSINASTGEFVWTPTEEQDGNYTVTLAVSDGLLSVESVMTIEVQEVNLSPIFTPILDQEIAEGGSVVFTVSSTDADVPVQELTYGLDQPSLDRSMLIDPITGVFEWTPTESQDGVFEVLISSSDGIVSTVDTIAITVVEVNIPPVLVVSEDQIVNELESLSVSLSANDIDIPVQALVFGLNQASLDLNMTIDATTGLFSWSPGEDQDGVYDVILSVTDGQVSDIDTLQILVNEVNVAPALEDIEDQIINEEAQFTYLVKANDPDVPVQNLSYSIDDGSVGKGMSIDVQSGIFTWTPAKGQTGAQNVTVSVSDGIVSTSLSFIIFVNEVSGNESPEDIALSNASIEAFTAAGSIVGQLTTVDQDHSQHNYEIINGFGFTIEGANLVTNEIFTNTEDSIAFVTIETKDPLNATYSEQLAINILQDSQPPIITAVSNPQTISVETASFELSANVSDLGLSAVTLNFKKLTDTDFTSIEMEEVEGVYRRTIETIELDGIGLNYTISAIDVTGNESSSQPMKVTLSFPESGEDAVSIETIQRFGGSINDYQIISIPYKFSGVSNRVDAVFNEYGGNPDQRNWRMIRFDGGSQSIVDLTGSYSLKLGEAYFFNAREEKDVRIGSATLHVDEPFELILREGWNLIGNPYSVDIDWVSVLANNVDGDKVGPLRLLDPDDVSAWPESEVLAAFSGAFVFVPPGSSTVNIAVSLNNATNAGRSGSYEQPNFDWKVDLLLSQNGSSSIGRVGMHRLASNGIDIYDLPKLPQVLRELSFDFSTLSKEDIIRSGDIVPVDEFKVWDVDVISDQDGLMSISWNVPNESSSALKLLDLERGIIIDMHEQISYSYNHSSSSSFKILYSTNSDEQFLTEQIIISEIFPNPMVSNTIKLPVLLPRGENTYQVKVTLSNILGQTVSSLVEIFQSGQNEVVMQLPDDLSMGVYLIDIEVNGNGQVKKGSQKLMIAK
jgi:hypothetical protein